MSGSRMGVRRWTEVAVFIAIAALVAFISFTEFFGSGVINTISKQAGLLGNDSGSNEAGSSSTTTKSGNSADLPSFETVSLPPMPDPLTPLSNQLPVLVERAKAGDPAAICRLVTDVNRCAAEARRREFTERLVKNLESKGMPEDDAMISMAARSQETFSESGGFCEGILPSALPQPSALNLNFNLLGVRQKVVLALMRQDGSPRRLNNRSPYSESSAYIYPQFLADHAYEFLVDGFNARDPLALEGLVMMHAPGKAINPQGIGIALPNPKLFAKYTWLLQRLVGDGAINGPTANLFRASLETMTEEDIAEIGQQVNDEYIRWTSFSDSKADQQRRIALSTWDPNSSVDSLSQCEIAN